VLTILDNGVAKATINLTGTFTTAGFVLSQDAKGGTQVIDPSTTSAAGLAQAMATFQSSPASGVAVGASIPPPSLPVLHAHG
jgi:hypothetical protein